MKKTIVTIITLLFLITMCAQAVEINSSFSVYTKNDGTLGQTVSIEGNSADYVGKMITLKIWHLGKGAANLVPNVNDFSVLAMIKQTVADENGNFSFEFPFTQNFGVYNCEIGIEGQSSTIPYSLPIANTQAANLFMETVNDSTKVNEINETLVNNLLASAQDTGIDIEYYNLLTNKSSVVQSMVSEIKKLNQNGTKMNFEDVLLLFDKTVILKALEASNDVTFLTGMMSHYDSLLNIQNLQGASGIYTTYTDIQDKTAFFADIGLKPYSSIEAFLEIFKEKTILRAVSEITYYDKFEKLIDDNDDYLSLGDSYTEYVNGEGIKDYVQKHLMANKSAIISLTSFQDYFDAGVELYKLSLEAPEDPPVILGGGGGGGGGGGSKNVSVESSLLQPEPSAPAPALPSFCDIENHWGNEAITYLTNNKIISGKSATEFAPDDNITREEFTKLVILAFYKELSDEILPFDDVKSERWSYPYIAYAYEKKIILGKEANMFYPEENISRQDMAVILYRIIENTRNLVFRDEINIVFEDYDTISRYAQNSVTMLSALNLIKGSENKFYPESYSTRAEAAQMIYNVLIREDLK